jgi:hypothetical protein
MFQVAVVGEPRLGFEVEPYLDVLILELQTLRESGQRSQSSLSQGLRLRVARQAQQCLPQLRRKQGRQGTGLWRLDPDRLDACGLGIITHAIEQDRLSDASKPDHQNALGRVTQPYPFKRDSDRFAQFVAASQFRGRCTRSGRKRVSNGIHGHQS